MLPVHDAKDYKCCVAMLDTPTEATLPDGRRFLLHGVRRMYDQVRHVHYSSAIAQWYLGGRLMTYLSLDCAAAVTLAEHWENLSC